MGVPNAPLCFDHRMEFWRRSGLTPLETVLITDLVARPRPDPSTGRCLVCNGTAVTVRAVIGWMADHSDREESHDELRSGPGR